MSRKVVPQYRLCKRTAWILSIVNNLNGPFVVHEDTGFPVFYRNKPTAELAGRKLAMPDSKAIRVRVTIERAVVRNWDDNLLAYRTKVRPINEIECRFLLHWRTTGQMADECKMSEAKLWRKVLCRTAEFVAVRFLNRLLVMPREEYLARYTNEEARISS